MTNRALLILTLAAGSMLPALVMPAAESHGSGTGRYPAVMLEESGLPEHVVYRPQSLATFGAGGMRMAVVVWGNGGCANAGNAMREFLTEVASHGYLVIASGPVKELPPPRTTAAPAPAAAPAAPGAGAASARVGPPPGAPGTENLSRTSQLLDAIAWAAAENQRNASPYHGKLDATRVATMGSSCGGLQAIEAAIDPRVTTTIAWSSGLLDQPRAGANVSRADLPKLHGPILYVTGGASDMASPFAAKDFAEVTVPIILATNEGSGHGGTLNQPNGGAWAPVGIAWLDWQLKGSKQAAQIFTGARCGLCADPAWKIAKKNTD